MKYLTIVGLVELEKKLEQEVLLGIVCKKMHRQKRKIKMEGGLLYVQ